MELITIQAEPLDAAEFIVNVEALANGILRRHEPLSLFLIKIDNWFSAKWLRFSGKTMGLAGVSMATLSVPPFIPNRVLSQKRFVAPAYNEVDNEPPIHIHVESTQAILRRVSRIANGAALLWYSGGSDQSGHGAIMAYVPAGNTYLPWYTDWAKRQRWELVQPKEITAHEIANLIQH
jgi:hypothetical protein